MITVLAVFWGAARAKDNPLNITYAQTATAMLALTTVMVSTVFCFLIVRVNWKFLGQVSKRREGVGDQAKDVYDFASEAKRLANVVDNRTHYYWIGWLLTFVVVWLPVILWLNLIPSWLLDLLKGHVPVPS